MNRYAHIVAVVSEHTGVPVGEIMGRCRNAKIFDARALAMYMIYQSRPTEFRARNEITPNSIGRYFSRHRSSVRNAIMRTEDRVLANEEFAEQVRQLGTGRKKSR